MYQILSLFFNILVFVAVSCRFRFQRLRFWRFRFRRFRFPRFLFWRFWFRRFRFRRFRFWRFQIWRFSKLSQKLKITTLWYYFCNGLFPFQDISQWCWKYWVFSPLQRNSNPCITYRKKILLQVEIYKGIPFAAPPIGSLRFMPPVTVTPWREIRSATHFGPVCPQILPDTRNETAALSMMSQGRLEAIRDMKPKLANQTEDCLYLNVYSPKSKSGKPFVCNVATRCCCSRGFCGIFSWLYAASKSRCS